MARGGRSGGRLELKGIEGPAAQNMAGEGRSRASSQTTRAASDCKLAGTAEDRRSEAAWPAVAEEQRAGLATQRGTAAEERRAGPATQHGPRWLEAVRAEAGAEVEDEASHY